MKKTVNLFVDMDGTIAKFYHNKKCLEKMYEENYFAKLPPYAIAKQINDFAKKDTCVEVYILSACVNSPYCESEKVAWLMKNMPNIKPQNYLFTKVGESKLVKAISCIGDENANNINVLLDDYTKNLEDWEENEGEVISIGIKFLNGMNDTTKTWQGAKVKTFKQL